MPRANFGAAQESWRAGGPAGYGCQLPRPSAEVSVRLLSGRAGTALRRFNVQGSMLNGLKAEARSKCCSRSNGTMQFQSFNRFAESATERSRRVQVVSDKSRYETQGKTNWAGYLHVLIILKTSK